MFEKVNPSHPDKVADRIAGALVDLAYSIEFDPRVAVEVLIGHGRCFIITESSVTFDDEEVFSIVRRIAGPGFEVDLVQNPQDPHLSKNQDKGFRCGDNGIFRGVPVTDEQKQLTELARKLYGVFQYDGKFIMDGDEVIVCQSNAKESEIRPFCPEATINPLGEWTGGPDVDSGATNRKLGSDMADSVTGGGLHGKDLGKGDISLNIYCFLKAQRTGKPVELYCAIGDREVDGKPYSHIVEMARDYINGLGGFERFAEWGLVR